MKIYNHSLEEALKKIKDREVQVTVVGNGTVGLPLSTFFAQNGFSVIAYDINSERVSDINSAKVVFEYSAILREVVQKKLLKATTNSAEAFANADFIQICVPTPIDENKQINLSHLKKASYEISRTMKPGSVIIDLAASSGRNCELTQNGKTIVVNGVQIVGKSDYPAQMPSDASKMFGCNIINLLKIMIDKEGKLNLNMQDDIINGTTAVHGKEYISRRVRQMLNIQ